MKTVDLAAGGRLLSQMAELSHEQLSFACDAAAGYLGIIAIHSTVLGPSVGGTRFWNYASEAEALADVLRLSRGMTYKAAVAGLDYGGGKSVVIGDPATANREKVFRAHGRHVDALGGRYIAAEDMNTSPADVEIMRRETEHVAGLADRAGDPSPFTAFGVFRGIKACAKHCYGDDSLVGGLVAVQGAGQVGYFLCRYLWQEGAELVVADLDRALVGRVVEQFGAQAIGPEDIAGLRADVLAPCAIGGVINDRTIDRLQVDIVAGAANNQLREPRHGERLHARGIVYAPDYVINAGGLMTILVDRAGWEIQRCWARVAEIYDTVLAVLEVARNDGVPPTFVADRMAEERLRSARQV